VLSISKLTPGQEFYYQRSVAAGLDDYYAGRGESPGIWAGRGAALLELDGVVQDGQLAKLVRGIDPASGTRLRKQPKRREIAVERIDPDTGGRRLETKTLSPVGGFDLVFSVPKSVSLLHALGDEETRLTVNAAHIAAWQAALSYLEDEACVTRRGKNGVEREHAGGFVAAAYQHRTSRAQDPHLHTHVIVANMASSPSDGKWRALDGDAILRTYRLAAGYLYQAHLRAELARSLGLEWEPPSKGMAEINGIPRSVLREFSQRRLQVLERIADWGTNGWRAAQAAARETRERKEHVDLTQLRDDWRARAAEQGLGRRELKAVLHRSLGRAPSRAELLRIARHMLGPEGLTAKRTAFSEPDLVMAWAEAHVGGAPAERVRALAHRFAGLEEVERVGSWAQPGRPAFYTTAELIAVERAALALVERGRGAGAPHLAREAVEGRGLSAEQREMARAVVTSPDRVVCAVGVAGAGKTTAVHAVASAFRAVGAPVLGAAPSGIAAERLRDETGIPATTLHRMLRHELPARCILVVDEAGMAETRVLAPILDRVERAGGKAVLLGDPNQLPAVGAGGLFAGIVERYGAIELGENRRQRDLEERQALEAIRQGEGREYLVFAQRRERLVVAESPLGARAQLVADWWGTARDDLAGNVMIALRRRDVAELNTLARALMEADGRLGAERLESPQGEFAPGDRIVCRRNSDRLGVRNGTRGAVEHLDRHNRTLAVVTDRGDRVLLDRHYLDAGHARHGYALTGHAGQGVTVERAFVLGASERRLQEWGYVALSRARESTRLYVTGSQRVRESDFAELDDRDPATLLAQSLEEPGAERLAVDQPPPASGRRQPRPEIDRLLARQREKAEKVRALTEQRLAEAERALDERRLGRHGRRGRELQAKAAFERRMLAQAEERLRELERIAAQREPAERPARAITDDRAPTRSRVQERTPRLERGRHLDLGR
jgi:conjugative relaxase-like TrwC/TraI family protein